MKNEHTLWLIAIVLIACGLAVRRRVAKRDEGFISAGELRPVRAVRGAVRRGRRKAKATVEAMVSGLRDRVRGGARAMRLIN